MIRTAKSTDGKARVGFACIEPERMREIAAEGGRTAHRLGRAHKFTPEEAREAARKSVAARANRRA